MFRRTASANCAGCHSRDWQLHCPTVRCSWYVCKVCALVFDPRHNRNFHPASVDAEWVPSDDR